MIICGPLRVIPKRPRMNTVRVPVKATMMPG